MPDNLRKVMVDGLSVETTDAGAQAIEKLTKDRDAAVQQVADAKAEGDKALAAKDAELAKKDAEIDDLKAKVLDAEALDAKVQARADLIDTAKAIAPSVDTKGVSDAGIKKAVVIAIRGAEAVQDKADAYIDATFDILAADASKQADPLARALSRATTADSTNPEAARDKAHEDFVARLTKTEA